MYKKLHYIMCSTHESVSGHANAAGAAIIKNVYNYMIKKLVNRNVKERKPNKLIIHAREKFSIR